MSEELLIYFVKYLKLVLTYLSAAADGVGTLFGLRRTGCQGFIGPLPSTFLDKRNFKERVRNNRFEN